MIGGGGLNLPTLVQRIKVAVDGQGDVENELSGIMSKVSGGLSKAGATLTKTLTVPIVGAFVAFGAAGVQAATDVDKGLREVNSLFGLTGKAAQENFGEIKALVGDLSKDVGIAQDVLTKGLYNAISAGVPKENAFTFMQVAAKASVAGVTDVNTAVNGLTSIINAFGLETTDAQRVADSMFAAVQGGKTTFEEISAAIFQIAPAAAAAKVSMEEVNASIATLTSSGVPTAVATTQLRAALTGLQRPSEDLDKIFKALGFNNAQAAIEAKGLTFALDAVRDASGGSNGRLTELLGSVEAVSAANILAGTGAEKMAAELDRQANKAGAATLAFEEMEQSTSRKMERLKVTFQNLSIQLGNVLIPVVEKVVATVLKAVDWFNKLDASGKRTVGMAVGIVAALGPVLLIMAKLVSATQTVFGGLASVGRGLGLLKNAEGARGGLAKVPDMLKAVGSGAKTAATSIASAASATASAVASFVQGAARIAVAAAAKVASYAAVAASAVASAAATAAAWLVAAAPFIAVGLVIAGVVAAIVIHWDTIKAATVATWGAITAAVSAAVDAVKTVISTAFEIVKTVVTTYVQVYLTIIRTAWEAIKAAVELAVGAVRRVIETVFGIVKTIIENNIRFWRNVIETGWAGIKAAVEVAVNAVRAVISTVFEVIRSLIERVVRGWQNIIETTWGAIRAVVSTAVGVIQTVISTAFGVISSTVSRIMDTVRNVISGAASAVIGIWSTLWTNLKGLVTSGFSAISGALSTAVETVLSWFRGLWGLIRDAIGDLGARAARVGRDIIDGLVNGIQAAPGKVKDALMGVVKGAWNEVLGFLGIKSPSRLFFGIGQNTVQGYIRGIQSEGGNLKSQMMALFGSATSGVQTLLGGLRAVQSRDQAVQAVADAERALARARSRERRLPGEIEDAEAALAKARQAAAAVTLQEEKNILEAKIAARDAERAAIEAQADGTLSAEERRLADINARLAQEAVTLAIQESTAATTEVAAATDILTGLRVEQRDVSDLVTEAERNLTSARYDLLAAEVALAQAGRDILLIGRESHEMFREMGRRAGIASKDIEKMAVAYSNLAGGINATFDAAARGVVPIAAAPKSSTPVRKLANGGTTTSAGIAMVGERGPEIVDLPKGATVIPLTRPHAAGAGGINGPLVSVTIQGDASDATVQKMGEVVRDAFQDFLTELEAS